HERSRTRQWRLRVRERRDHQRNGGQHDACHEPTEKFRAHHYPPLFVLFTTPASNRSIDRATLHTGRCVDKARAVLNNRGVALWKDKVISIALDGRMFAINKVTGEVVWERKIAEPALGETLTIAPLVIRDLGIVGAAGGEFGIRGYIDATDLNTGK